MEGAGHGKRLPFSNDREQFPHRGQAMKIIVLAHPKGDQQPCFPRFEEKTENQKEKCMSSNTNNRVLTRRGARRLSAQEIEQITGGKVTPLTLMLTGSASGTDESPDQ